MSVRIEKYTRGRGVGYTAHVHVQIPGRPEPFRKSKTLETRTKAKAWGDAEERRAYEELEAGRLGRKPRVVPTLAEFAPRFVDEHARANRHKASGIEDKESILRTHLVPRFGHLRLDQIDTASVQRMRADLARQKKSPKTVENILTVLRKLLKTAVEWQVIDDVPCKIARTKVPTKTRPFYTFEEYERLLAEAQVAGRTPHLVVLLGGEAGLRLGEMQALQWRNVNFHTNRIIVEASEWWGVVDGTKGMRARAVPMTDRLRADLMRYREPAGLVLGGKAGSLTQNQVRSCLRPVARKARVQHGVHVLRHSFCSHLAMRGAPARAIQELAGHENLSTTERYMHLAPGHAELAIALLNPPHTARPDGATGVQQLPA